MAPNEPTSWDDMTDDQVIADVTEALRAMVRGGLSYPRARQILYRATHARTGRGVSLALTAMRRYAAGMVQYRR